MSTRLTRLDVIPVSLHQPNHPSDIRYAVECFPNVGVKDPSPPAPRPLPQYQLNWILKHGQMLVAVLQGTRDSLHCTVASPAICIFITATDGRGWSRGTPANSLLICTRPVAQIRKFPPGHHPSHQFIIIIIITFIMHHSISVPLQTQNLPFPQILTSMVSLTFFQRISRIYDHFGLNCSSVLFCFVFLFSSFLFESCNKLSWFNQLLICTLDPCSFLTTILNVKSG